VPTAELIRRLIGYGRERHARKREPEFSFVDPSFEEAHK
jgi:hypothetical protein